MYILVNSELIHIRAHQFQNEQTNFQFQLFKRNQMPDIMDTVRLVTTLVMV